MTKLLIVDDEKLTREILVKYIPWQEVGIDTVKEAADGAEALELALSMQPDIVLCDIRMPKMSGIELAKHLKDKLPECKIVFLSVYSDKDYLKSAIQLNAVDYVEKPIDTEEVKNAVARAVNIVSNEKMKRREFLKQEDGTGKGAINRETLAFDLIEKVVDGTFHDKVVSSGINLPSDCNYFTVIIKLNHLYDDTNDEKNQRFKYVFSALNETFRNAAFPYVMGGRNDEYAIMHFFADKTCDEAWIKNYLEDFNEKIKKLQDRKIKVFIGVGQHVYEMKDIRKSYQTALISVQKQFFYGYNCIVFYNENYSKEYCFDDNILQLITGNLKERKKNETIILIKRLTNEIRKHDNTIINYVRNCYYKILSQIYKFAEEMNVRINDNSDSRKFLWEVISTSYTLYEIEEYLVKLVISIFDYMESEAGKNNIPVRIIKYINENIQDANLSIKTIADHLYLTPTYLCLIFKKEMDKTINQYITELRIEKAKEYLKDKRIKCSEVSSKVGYSDAKYFAKVFKKEAGVTPSEYKDTEQV